MRTIGPQHRWIWLAAAATLSCPLFTLSRAADAPAAADPRREGVQQLIDRYFHSWSSQDINRYGQCFMPAAVVQFIDADGRLVSMSLGQFLRGQQEAHRKAAQPMTETAESVDIRFEAELARVVVHWKLVNGAKVETGYDHFTLMRSDGKWRIANLIFYADKPAAEATK
jgi:hypothetical protein